MFYISLPFFYQNYKFNNFFKKYINDSNMNKESKLISKFNIEYVYGSFPWSIWNGGQNVHNGHAVLTPEMLNHLLYSENPFRIDASNINLSHKDYYDIHENMTLDCCNKSNCTYEISDINFMKYLQNKNINNKYIISNNAELLHLFNEDIINIFTAQNEIELINIGYNSNLNLALINNKSKLELSIGHCGKCSKEKILFCSSNEQKNIYNYSGNSHYFNCNLMNKDVNYYNQLLPYYQQGIQHFKIHTSLSNLEEFNINIIKSFVKPEYIGDCIYEYYKVIK